MKNLIKEYCNYAKNTLGRSQDVVNHHYYNLNQFYEFVAIDQGFGVHVDQITLKHCLDFLAHYRVTPIQYGPNKGKLPTQNTICEKSKSLRVFFEYIRAVGYLGFNREMIPKLQKTRDTIDMRKTEEYKILRQAPLRYEKKEAIALRNQLLIDIPYAMGLRRAEILRCTFENFRSPNRQFDILGKGGRFEATFFPDKLRDQVEKYAESLKEFTKYRKIESDLLFVGLDNKNRGSKLAPCYINLIYKKYSKLLIKDGKLSRELTPHMGGIALLRIVCSPDYLSRQQQSLGGIVIQKLQKDIIT